ncbi:MAG: bifunctional enoyl-CoA hydratase/phosphate acetyltransferase [Oceanospirillaceae bacterium]|nr:bifunctional enoyl-CoA hydratase/phosphate acetyltransferase [Oceanospirillaceae bacterium]
MLSKVPVECPARLLEQARGLPKVATAVVNPVNRVSLESARLAADAGLIEPLLVGDRDTIHRIADEIEWDLGAIRVEAAADEAQAARGATQLVAAGDARSLMKGHLHTDTLLRAVLSREAGLRTERRLSHIFHMTVPGHPRPLCITDAVINVQPSVIDKAHILRNAIDLLHALGIARPKVALLSGTEEVTRAMPSSVEAGELVKLAALGVMQDAIVEGPLAFDNAISREAAELKGIKSQVAGDADLLLVPNIETGNCMFKQMVYFMSATAAGLVLGARVPVILTSRADPPAARLASCALASIYSHYQLHAAAA